MGNQDVTSNYPVVNMNAQPNSTHNFVTITDQQYQQLLATQYLQNYPQQPPSQSQIHCAQIQFINSFEQNFGTLFNNEILKVINGMYGANPYQPIANNKYIQLAVDSIEEFVGLQHDNARYTAAANWIVNLAKAEGNYMMNLNVNPFYAYQFNNIFDKFDLDRDGNKASFADFIQHVANANSKNTRPGIQSVMV